MTKRFLRISTAHTLRETLAIILYGEERGYNASAIVIINQEGDFAGIALSFDASSLIEGVVFLSSAGNVEVTPKIAAVSNAYRTVCSPKLNVAGNRAQWHRR